MGRLLKRSSSDISRTVTSFFTLDKQVCLTLNVLLFDIKKNGLAPEIRFSVGS